MPSLASIIAALTLATFLAGCTDPAESRGDSTPKAGNTGQSGRTPTAPGGLSTLLNTGGTNSEQSAPTLSIDQPQTPGTLLFLGLEAPISKLWHWQPPRAVGQLADFVVPGPQGSEPAQLVIWAPGRSRTSVLEQTVPEWAKQFRTGVIPVPPDVQHLNVADMPVSVIELHGEFSGVGGGWHRPDWKQLSAVFDGPDCSVVVRLHGPNDTVEAHRDSFMRMINGLRVTPPF